MEMGRDTPLSALLPGLRGRGLCSLALIHYLTTVHNQFIEDYHRLAKTKYVQSVFYLFEGILWKSIVPVRQLC